MDRRCSTAEKRREPVGADQTQQDLQQPFCKWLRSREQSKEPTSSCVQEVATDEEGYDSTNGLISATFPSKKETKNAAWGTSYGVKDSACDPMNIDSLKSTCSFRGYSSVSACSSEKASDILKSIAGVSLPYVHNES
ncbi:uncharacterized protein LOC144134184 [Amblyomma americanum]